MKKSRSSTPRLDARCPGLEGTAGACEDLADPRVAIAVGKTLVSRLKKDAGAVKQILQGWAIVSRETENTMRMIDRLVYPETHPILEYPVPLSLIMGANKAMKVENKLRTRYSTIAQLVGRCFAIP